MPRGGHNAKPTALKLLQGNPGKRPLDGAEPQPTPVRDLKPPAWLDATAKRCWRENAPELQRLGLLTQVDATTLALYCQAYSRYRTALQTLSRIAPESEAYRPVAVTVEKAEASLRMLAADFGMTPSSRARLSVGGGKEPEKDPLEELLSGRRRA